MGKPLKIGVLYSRVRVEEKWIFAALDTRGVDYDRLDDRESVYDLNHPESWLKYDAVLERSISTVRGLYALRMLNAWGVPTVNSYETALNCGDKLNTSALLAKAGVPQPRFLMAFTAESALEAIETLGYPVVLKPVVGSWGRLLAKINDRDAAEAHPGAQGNARLCAALGLLHPGIHPQTRAGYPRLCGAATRLVTAIYRKSSHWITNTARGGEGRALPGDA